MAILQSKNTSSEAWATDIETPSFKCTLTTAKEKQLKGLSTLIWLPEIGSTPVAEIKYGKVVSKNELQKLHDEISSKINSAGKAGISFSEALDSALIKLCKNGLVSKLTMSSDWV